MGLLDIGMSLISGGATGILGLGLQGLFTWLNKRQENDYRLESKRLDAEFMKEEWAQRAKVAKIEGETAENVADTQAESAVRSQSYAMLPKRLADGDRPEGAFGKIGWFLMALTDVFRSAIRPGLTVWLAYLAWDAKTKAEELLLKSGGLGVHAQVMVETYQYVVWTLLYLFSTCVTWWFGTRMKDFAKFMKGRMA